MIRENCRQGQIHKGQELDVRHLPPVLHLNSKLSPFQKAVHLPPFLGLSACVWAEEALHPGQSGGRVYRAFLP